MTKKWEEEKANNILGSHGDESEDGCLVECCAM
jgi:hypothetical protein